MIAGVDIRWRLCVVLSLYRERQRQAGAGENVTTREVRQGGQVAGAIQWTGFGRWPGSTGTGLYRRNAVATVPRRERKTAGGDRAPAR